MRSINIHKSNMNKLQEVVSTLLGLSFDAVKTHFPLVARLQDMTSWEVPRISLQSVYFYFTVYSHARSIP